MPEPFAIVGTGRTASVLGQALRDQGASIIAVAGRHLKSAEQVAARLNSQPLSSIRQVPQVAGRALVAVSDEAIEEVFSELQGCCLVLHTSGAAGYLKVPGIAGSGILHPLQTFPDTKGRDLTGTTFATGGDTAAETWAMELVETMRGKAVHIPSDGWRAYHAAAVFASNYQVTLLDAAFELMQAAGLTREQASTALEPLTRTVIENTFRRGPEAALSGPIRRGDVTTVQRHLEILERGATRDLYVTAAKRTLPIAARIGVDVTPFKAILR